MEFQQDARMPTNAFQVREMDELDFVGFERHPTESTSHAKAEEQEKPALAWGTGKLLEKPIHISWLCNTNSISNPDLKAQSDEDPHCRHAHRVLSTRQILGRRIRRMLIRRVVSCGISKGKNPVGSIS